ncbi:hypothetical protein PITCH_A190140 [uncultured Desulfobacterium sp.]|uniref:Uncharacterized protein n=1 Tax=uncultured Desulfobacterium sp. TaxID=201089 RepID=A0A445MVL8_9BACT|nr:hypothetical protein PITCH_A190140 [uncultured Desulfobacterium sp.]
MEAATYKLGEYKLTEYDAGHLRWEAHFGLGALKEGRCFTKGEILFIGPADNDRPGFLKAEFLDHLKKLPEWHKTKYYFAGLDVYNCMTGNRVTKEEMLFWMLKNGIDEDSRILPEKSVQRLNNLSTRRDAGELNFRLQKYQIILNADGHVLWKTYAGPSTGIGGTGIILEDILFIGSPQNEQSNFTKRQFLADLQKLPKWDQTRYFCPKLSLHECKAEDPGQIPGKWSPIEKSVTETISAENIYKSEAEFQSNVLATLKHLAKKCITYIGILILWLISAFFDYLIHTFKRLKRKYS